jgi:hypothetical protein
MRMNKRMAMARTMSTGTMVFCERGGNGDG